MARRGGWVLAAASAGRRARMLLAMHSGGRAAPAVRAAPQLLCVHVLLARVAVRTLMAAPRAALARVGVRKHERSGVHVRTHTRTQARTHARSHAARCRPGW